MSPVKTEHALEIRRCLNDLKRLLNADGICALIYSHTDDARHLTLQSVGEVPTYPLMVSGLCEHGFMNAYELGRQSKETDPPKV